MLSRMLYLLKINFLKSAIVNFRLLGLIGLLKMPILLQYGSSIHASRGSVIFMKPLRLKMLTLNRDNAISIERGGCLVLHGTKACFNYRNSVNVFANAVFELGDNFYANGLGEFNCRKRIAFGNGCLISVHTMFLDTDFHEILDQESARINDDREIIVGNRVWIGCNVTVLKGTVIGNDIVIGAGSQLSGKYIKNNSVYVSSSPVRLVKSGIRWRT